MRKYDIGDKILLRIDGAEWTATVAKHLSNRYVLEWRSAEGKTSKTEPDDDTILSWNKIKSYNMRVIRVNLLDEGLFEI